jgi:hypothetical protein
MAWRCGVYGDLFHFWVESEVELNAPYRAFDFQKNEGKIQFSIGLSRQYFVKPVVDARIPITRSGNFTVLTCPLLVREVDHRLGTTQRIVEFLRLSGKKLFAFRGRNQHGAMDASANLREIVFLHSVKGVAVRVHSIRPHSKAQRHSAPHIRVALLHG